MDKAQIINLSIEILNQGKTTEIIANGISMFPLLRPGDILKIQPKVPIKTGDIIVFKGETTLIAHRIKLISGDKIYCKGDSLFSMDTPITFQEVLGKVIARKRKGKIKPVTNWLHRLFSRFLPYTGKYISFIFRWWAILWLKTQQ